MVAEAGADLSHTIMAHLDRTVFEKETLTAIAESGCYLEWDLFGREQSYYPLNLKAGMPSDAKRMEDIAWTTTQLGRGDDDKLLEANEKFAITVTVTSALTTPLDEYDTFTLEVKPHRGSALSFERTIPPVVDSVMDLR